jgi:hypothetical protein
VGHLANRHYGSGFHATAVAVQDPQTTNGGVTPISKAHALKQRIKTRPTPTPLRASSMWLLAVLRTMERNPEIRDRHSIVLNTPLFPRWRASHEEVAVVERPQDY